MADHDTHDHTGVTGVGDMSNPMTTSGDVIYGGASGTPTRLAKGTDGDVLTLASGVPSWAAGGGGGGSASQAYLGYNAIGASWQALTSGTVYARKITVPTGGGFLMSIDAYTRGNNDGGVAEWIYGVWSDNSGVMDRVIAENATGADSHYMDFTGRWSSRALGAFLAAGVYWIGVISNGSSQIAYDTGGSSSNNATYGIGAWYAKDVSLGGTPSGSTNDCSIRANMLYV